MRKSKNVAYLNSVYSPTTRVRVIEIFGSVYKIEQLFSRIFVDGTVNLQL